MNYLERLNEEQRKAATHVEGPLLILAGAGSGKTSTMTCRIAYLIKEIGINPYNILAVTFTNKAAGEMRDRVEALLGGNVSMWILTFHAACLRILRSHADVLGYSNDFVVYDPTDQKTVVKNICKEMQLDKMADTKKLTPAYFLSVISDCKEKEWSPKQFASENGAGFDYGGRTKIIADVYEKYEAILRKNNAMDFDDLLLNTVRLFERDEAVLLKYRNRFKFLMVDEYQDTNRVQYKFIKMLAEENNNICVVGDDDQCIYQWRGADIRNILEFEKDFKGTKVIKLEKNYRSTSNILNAAHSVVTKNRQRKDKKMEAAKGIEGEKIKYLRADDEKDEASYVASEINRLHGEPGEDGRPLEYRNFAILYRTNAQSRTFEDALSKRGLPYRVLGGLRYYDRKEIKDMMAYMRLVQNPSDDLALARIINEPKRGIGDKTLEKIRAIADFRGTGMLRCLMDGDVISSLPQKAGAAVTEMTGCLKKYAEEKENLRVSDIYDGLLRDTGYFAALEQQNTIEAEGRMENLLEFKSVILDYEKEDINLSLSEFMEKIALLAEVDNHDENEDAVVLMTLHSAKGLEFPVVFMPGMEDGLFPGWRSIEKEGGLDEERRLCYVGMTRAKIRLYLLSAAMRTLYGKTDFTRESQFLQEIDRRYMEGDGVYVPKKRTDEGFGYAFGSGGGRPDGITQKEPYHPWAAQTSNFFKDSKQDVKAPASGSSLKLAVGDAVSHAKFGDGLVMEVSAKVVTVMFDSVGIKKLAKDIAPLKKLNAAE
ncbi:MAG: UvrD-helicase domain-containing protein [Clostridia bacterium]|nr:UvrD-helicase domain-containing protein [Clostridia bacterium]